MRTSTTTPARMPQLVVLTTAIAAAIAVLLLTAAKPAEAAPADQRISWQGKRWFLTGANLPWYRKGDDFGSRNGGVYGNRAFLSRQFATMNKNGVKVVRWYVFPGNAPQIQRDGTGAPTAIGANTLRNFDMAIKLAQQHDLYFQFVLFEGTEQIPSTWYNAHREELANTLAPLFARYGKSNRVLSWEIFNEPEIGIDANAPGVLQAEVQATVARIAAAIHTRGKQKATIGSRTIDDLDRWANLGLDFYSPHWFSSMTDAATNASAIDANALRAREALEVGTPIAIGAVNTGSAAMARERYFGFYRRGYAGMIVWSYFPRAHPSWPEPTGVRFGEALRFIYAAADIGPRSMPLNPCLGPLAGSLKCPNLKMRKPFGLFVSRGGGRTRLHAGNSIDSVGKGPVEVFGTRSGRYTMNAVQRIWRKGTSKRYVVKTGAQLYFKNVPGQGRYWKYKNAARFELFRLDSQGRRLRRVKVGPKAIYCLRDLVRTHGSLPGAPRGRYYPGCSQNSGIRNVRLGTSVGWSDVYPPSYPEQYIDVTGMRGCFAYVHTADPNNGIWESNEADNQATIVVRLPYNGSNGGCAGGGAASAASASGGSYNF